MTKFKLEKLNSKNGHFKAGKYIISDACYIVKDEEWNDFCDVMYKDSPNGIDDKGAIGEYEGYKFFICHTAYGDGDYPVYKDKSVVGTCGVDAGNLSLIPFDLAAKWNKKGWNEKSWEEAGHVIEVKKAFSIKLIGEGSWAFLDYRIMTCEDSNEVLYGE